MWGLVANIIKGDGIKRRLGGEYVLRIVVVVYLNSFFRKYMYLDINHIYYIRNLKSKCKLEKMCILKPLYFK